MSDEPTENTNESELPEDPFTEEEMEALQEEINEIANNVLDEMDPDEVESFFRKLGQDEINDSLDQWKAMYGFDHECSCATDMESGNTVTISRCYAGAADQAFDALRRARLFLYAIATTPSVRASTLRRIAEEGFEGR